MSKSVKILWRLFFLAFICINILIFLFWKGWIGDMPPIAELENPSSALSSEVYADDGSLLGRYYVQDRSNSKFDEISDNVIHALIATEDERFYKHSGVDGQALLRAVVFLGKKGGGSTLTQQLAKNLFPRRNPNLFTMPFIKLKEWVLAVKLERNLTKNEILTLYLNTVPFGDNVYGIKNAALTFYQKEPNNLTVDEAAVLIGMLKGNTLYNPRRNPERSFERRNVVLGQMEKEKYITPGDARRYAGLPIKLNYKKMDNSEGLAPYLRVEVAQFVKELCKNLEKPEGGTYNIYRDGLKIYTTINVKMQRHAEEAAEEHLSEYQKLFIAQSGYRDGSIWKNKISILNRYMKESERYAAMKDAGHSEAEIQAAFTQPTKMRVFAWNKNYFKDTVMTPLDSIKYMRMFLQTGFCAMDPYTGAIKAWVGGINHTYFKFDHVNVNTTRQVGSTIKPLLYCLAVDNGFSPCSSVSTSGQVFNGKLYSAGGKGGWVNMRSALAASINNAALYLIKNVGIDAFVDFIKKCGVSAKIERFPSIALGVSDISLFEMLRAYTMFPTGGINTQPVFVTKVEDKNGNLLKNIVPEQKEIISQETAYKMVKMMQGVIDNGTGRRARFRYGLKMPAAGKTGTTNNQTDAWFIGYTPQLLAGAWVGCDDQFLRFRSEYLGQGAAAALPIWALFMKKVYADKSLALEGEKKFEIPEDFNECGTGDPTSIDRASYINPGSSSSYMDNDPMEEVTPVNIEEWGGGSTSPNPPPPETDF